MRWRTYFGHIGTIGWAFRMVYSKYWGKVLENKRRKSKVINSKGLDITVTH
jgi:hypothetical protein